MTIDQLLTDVTPLLPFDKDNISHWAGKPGTHYDEKYLAHAANHFPAMLQALRIIKMSLDSGTPSALASAKSIVRHALAAASEVGT